MERFSNPPKSGAIATTPNPGAFNDPKSGGIQADRLLHSLRARVDVLRNEMNAARLEYLRAQLELRTLQGDKHEADRTARQIRNLLHAERPRKARKARS